MYIRPEEMGDGFGTVNVNDLEKEYLSEIADFGNSTVNKEVALHIPVPGGKWNGLRGDANYKFRLDTVCPGMYMSNDPEIVKRKVVSSFEFVVYTNSPPSGGELQVKPENGTALRTFFEISSESAKDLLLDTPLSYEFLLQVEQFSISLGKFYEFKSLDTQLPYSESPIQVMSRVCDIRGSCNTNAGPKIKTNWAKYTQQEIESMESRIAEAFKRTDFNEGHNLILITALTYKNTPKSEDTYRNFNKFATNLLIKEIDKQYESPTEKYYISKEDIVNFISQTKNNLDVLDIRDPKVLEKLLDLLDLTAEESNDDISENVEDFRRRKRDTDTDGILLPLEGRSIIDADYVRMNLNLIDKILQTYKDENMKQEKAKIVQKIPILAMKMCTSDLITKENIYTSVAAIDIDKMTGNHLIEKNFTIFNYFTPALGDFQIILRAFKSRVKYYCAAFIQFPEDYFDGEKHVSYRLQMVDMATSTLVKEVDSYSDNFVVELKLPKYDDAHDVCLMREGEQWNPNLCSTKIVTRSHVICDCRHFGFFKTGSHHKYEIAPSVVPFTRKPVTMPPPNKSIVSSTNKAVTTITAITTPIPKLVTPSKTTQATPIKTTTPMNGPKTKDGNLKQSDEITSTASTLSIVLPLIGLSSILLIIGAMIFYKRRKTNSQSNNLQGLEVLVNDPISLSLEYRQILYMHAFPLYLNLKPLLDSTHHQKLCLAVVSVLSIYKFSKSMHCHFNDLFDVE